MTLSGSADCAECLVAMALGLLSMTRLEMYLRGSRLLREAKAGQA